MTRKDIELALWRSGLLRRTLATGALQDACAATARHLARVQRAREGLCNGVPKEWDARRREHIMGLDDADTDRLTADVAKGQAAVEKALRPFLTPGTVWRWRSDPRYGHLRLSDKGNTRDLFL